MAIAATGLAAAVWLPTRFDRADAAEQGFTLKQVFSDDFDGSRGADPDDGKWSEDGRGVELDGDGNVAIFARPGRRERSADAGIQSRQTFASRAGKAEARVRVADGESVRSVFQLLGADNDDLDVLNNRGNRSKVLRASHGRDVTGQTEGQQSFAADFHTYAVRWEPGLVVWTVDDKEFLRDTGDSAELSDSFAVSLEVTAGDTDRDRTVRRMLIDSVSVSVEDETPPADEPPATEEPTLPPTEEPTTPPATEEPTSPPTTPPATPPAEEPTTPPTSEPPATQEPEAPAAAPWEPFTLLNAGDRVTFGGATYEVLSTHTSLPGWEPNVLPALFKKI